MLRKGRFNLVPLRIHMAQKPSFHLAPVLCLRPFSSMRSRVERNDSLADSKFLASDHMVLFTVKPCISQNTVYRHVTRCSFKQRSPQHAFVRRASINVRRQNEMRIGIARNREFCPVSLFTAFVLYARQVVPAGVAFFQASRIKRYAQAVLEVTPANTRSPGLHQEAHQSACPLVVRRDTKSNNVEHGITLANSRHRGSLEGIVSHRENLFSTGRAIPAGQKVEAP